MKQNCKKNNSLLKIFSDNKNQLALKCENYYRQVNDKQKIEYMKLNSHITLEEKDYVLDEIRKNLLEAEEGYRLILKAMFSYADLFFNKKHFEKIKKVVKESYTKEKEVYLNNILKFFKEAAELEEEVGLEKEFPLEKIKEPLLTFEIPEAYTEANEIKNKIVEITDKINIKVAEDDKRKEKYGKFKNFIINFFK